MKILQLSITKSWGGGGLQMENLGREITRLYSEADIIFFCAKHGKLHQRLKKSSFDYVAAPLRTKVDPRFIFKLIRTCKKRKIDLIHIHGPDAIMVAIIADKLGGLPPFVFTKKTMFPIRKRRQTLYKYNYHKLKKIICISGKVKEVTEKAIPDPDRLALIYDGLQFETLHAKPPFLIREKFNTPFGKKMIGTIGNHIEAKDLSTWISVIDTIVNKKKRKDFHFIQIGNFSHITPELEAQIEALKLKPHVHLMGYMPQASAFIPQFDALLVTSKSEGLPLVLLEAFYLKVPVVTTKVGIAPEVIENGTNGFMAEIKDPATLADHLLHMVENESLTQQFTGRSFEKLFPRFTSETMARATWELYKEVINPKPGSV